MSEYWIRKGTNDFSYEIFGEGDEIVKSLSKGDQFYDAIVTEPIEGGIHVIEYSEYQRVCKLLEQTWENLMQCRNEQGPKIEDAINLTGKKR